MSSMASGMAKAPTKYLFSLTEVQGELAPYIQSLAPAGVSVSMLMGFVVYAWSSMVYSGITISHGYFYNEAYDHIGGVLTDSGIISTRDDAGEGIVVACIEACELIYNALSLAMQRVFVEPGYEMDYIELLGWSGPDPIIGFHTKWANHATGCSI